MEQMTANPLEHRGQMMQSVSSCFGASRAIQAVLATVAALVVATATLFGLGMPKAEAQSSPTYSIKDLGVISGDNWSEAADINNAGQLVGSSGYDSYYDNPNDWENSRYTSRPFFYDSKTNGPMKDLGKLGTEERGYSEAINGLGNVAGGSYSADGNRAFLYKDGAMTNLGTLSQDDDSSWAAGINDKDQVVGSSITPDNVTWYDEEQAFLYENGTMKDIGTTVESDLGGLRDSAATAINDSGQVVGYAINPEDYDNSDTQPYYKAWLYSNGAVTDLGGLAGSVGHVPRDINNLGHVVGDSYPPDPTGEQDPSKAFLYKDGQMQDLGKLSGYDNMYAKGINDKGQIVGSAETNYDSNYNSKNTAALYSDGQWFDLNNLIPADSGWEIGGADEINEDGQIVGWARKANDPYGPYYAVLLSPPSPNQASENVQPGDTVSTGGTATDKNPVSTSVTSPIAGTVSIDETPTLDQTAPSGYSFFGQQINIKVPGVSTPENPYKFEFVIDSTLLPPGADQNSVEIFRSGIPLPQCTGPAGTASPDPCISERQLLSGESAGDIRITALTTNASPWNMGIRATSSVQPPPDQADQPIKKKKKKKKNKKK